MRHPRRLRWAAAAAVAGLTACSWPSSSGTPAALPGRHLTRARFEAIEHATNVWPLRVDSGTLSCVEVRQRGRRVFAVVFTTEDGNQYALNGTAENTGRFRPGVEIYRPTVYDESPDPDPTWLIGHGLDLCPHYRPGF